MGIKHISPGVKALNAGAQQFLICDIYTGELGYDGPL